MPVVTIYVAVAITCLVCYCKDRRKKRRETLTWTAPRNCTILQRNDKVHRQIKKLCKNKWHRKAYHHSVLNVSVVTNISLRQRYEQACQAAQSAAPPSYIAAQSAAQPSYLTAQSAAPPSYLTAQSAALPSCLAARSAALPSYLAVLSAAQHEKLEAAKMAYLSSNSDDKQTSVVSLESTFEPGVLRKGEMYLFYHTDWSELKAVLDSRAEPAFSCMRGRNSITLEEFSSNFERTLFWQAKYMFVVRAIIGADTVICEPDPKDKRAGRTYRKSNLSEVLPEFLVRYKVKKPCENTGGGGGYVFSGGGGGGCGGGGGGGCGGGC